MKQEVFERLSEVRKPARYTGGEINSVIKDKAQVDIRIAHCFPEVYEIGMSHLGSRILYSLMNSMEGVWCERAFAPFPDMEELMKKYDQPLYALESGDPVSSFDFITVSIQYELNYTTMLNMLSLAGVPFYSEERDERYPIVMGGGPCVYNIEPVADFFDLIVIGEGEEVNPEIILLYRECKKAGFCKKEFLKKAARIPGVYVPSFYSIKYQGDNLPIVSVTAENGAPDIVVKRVVKNMDEAYFPDKFIVPSTEIVFDRAMVEIFRGCRRGCRFCQAGYTYRPIRARSPEVIEEQARKLIASTGYDELSLTSLSSSDYPEIKQLCSDLICEFERKHVSLALPSQRADSVDVELMDSLQKVRKSGITFAAEAGTDRLRNVINKNLSEEELLEACKTAFAAGWNNVKLYFMMGLPTETDEDLLAISQLIRKVFYVYRNNAKNVQRGLRVSAGISTFVPKAQTPFQWFGQTPTDEVRRRQALLFDSLKIKNVNFNLSDPQQSFLEAVFSRGDRRLAPVIVRAWELGCNLDGWSDYFRKDMWMQAFKDTGVDPGFYANRTFEYDDILPWDHISSGVRKDFLWEEYQKALKNIPSPDCKAGCRNCGATSLTGEKCHV